MMPTLRSGDRLLVRHGSEPRIGGLVVVRLPGTGGVVAVKRATMRTPEGWWVERDNPVEGVDSWNVGAVPPDQVTARVLGRVWPRPSLLRGPHSGSRRA
jgi:signal peptidase I